MIKKNIDFIKSRIDSTCLQNKIEPSAVSLLAATKTQNVETIKEAVNFGVKICGENYLKEAEAKIPLIKNVDWHFIGHLQSNKAKKAVELFDCIESVDTVKLARKINDAATDKFPIFLSVNIGEEENKFGVKPNAVEDFFLEVKELENLDVKGLFCMAPYVKDTSKYFQTMSNLSTKLKLSELSMGMSNDYLTAIKNGSTIVRLGSSIFGERD